MSVNVNGSLPLVEVDPDNCPKCGVSLLGTPIYSASKHLYGDATHFRREMGVETDAYDGVLYWVCPDCHGAWPRFTSTDGAPADRLALAAADAVAEHAQNVGVLADTATVGKTLTVRADEIAFALALHGFGWAGWATDTRAGAWLYLLVTLTDSTGASMEKARALVRDITGYPVALVGEQSPTARQLPNVVHV